MYNIILTRFLQWQIAEVATNEFVGPFSGHVLKSLQSGQYV